MPLCHDVPKLIKDIGNAEHRSLILIDAVLKDPPSWGYYDHPYEIKNTYISEDQFLATKVKIGSGSSDTVFTVAELPVLMDIGGFKVTVIVRKKDGTLVYKNGESCPTALLMGLE